MVNSFDVIKSAFLIILAISGNFIAETLGCKTQLNLSNNMYIKHSVILLMLYFTLGYVNGGKPVHPLVNFKFSVLIWVIFLMFTKMNPYFTLGFVLLLTINYIIYTFIEYYKSIDKDDSRIKKLHDIFNGITSTLLVILVIGFTLYFMKQYNDYSDDWSYSKFIFGVTKCNSLN